MISTPFSTTSEPQPIATAPRNGLTIMVGDPDCGQFLMHWEADAKNGMFPGATGFWVSLDRSFTWSEHDGAGPSYWFPMVEDEPSPTRASPAGETDQAQEEPKTNTDTREEG